jgi:N-methylhydantoinase B
VNEDAYRIILANVRGGSIVRMDNMLVQAAMIKAEEKILDICEEYGKDVVRAAIESTIKSTEQAIRREISTWPAGVYEATRAGDCDGTTRDPVWIKLVLTIKPDVGELIFDYTDNPKQVDFINVPKALVWAFSIIPLRWTLPAGKYLNQALANCITVKTTRGTVLDPVYPATGGASSPSLGGQIEECVQLALSKAVPQKAPSCWSRHVSPILAGKHPDLVDPRTGSRRWYWSAPFTSDGSSGAIWGYDGWDSLDDPETAGGGMRASIEQCEADIPWRWLRCEWATDSAGNGQWRGGMGTHAEYLTVHPPEAFRPGDIYIITGNSNGEVFPAFGIAGAPDGVKTKMWLKRKGKTNILHTMDILPGQPGDLVITISQGGGGVGNPLDRDIEKVRMDALDEIISLETARKAYKVVIDPETFEVDYDATNKLRAKKKKKVNPSQNQ